MTYGNEQNTEHLDPYAVLGVRRQATMEEIRRTFHDKIRACHPDLGTESERVVLFKRLTWAYRQLQDIFHAREAASKPSTSAMASSNDELQEILNSGREHLAAGDAPEAETIFRLALRRCPNLAAIYALLAEALLKQHRYEEGYGCIGMALHLGGDPEELYPLMQQCRGPIPPT